MQSTLQVHLLGEFWLQYDDRPIVTLATPRLQSLVGYLALQPTIPQSRQHLAYLFWPDSSEAQARTNLRKQLFFLRRELPDSERLLQVDTKTIRWRPQIQPVADVAQFEQALAAAEADRAAVPGLQAAVDLYGGELLPDCYDEWVLTRRAELQGEYLRALERLILCLEDQREIQRAIAYAEQLLRHDPFHEPTYRRLLRLHALAGNHAAALQAYQTCTERLAELGAEPGPETLAAHARLLRGDLPVVLRQRHAPAAASPFIGRQDAWQSVQQAWRTMQRGEAHVVVIRGEAGIGKTRLVEELLTWADRQGVSAATARCYAMEGRLAYAPIVEWLESRAVSAGLATLNDRWLVELARLLPGILAEWPHLPPPEPATESWQRRQLFEALTQAMLAAELPLLLVLDDLQWCDQETLEWLHFFLRNNPQACVLVVATVRTGEVAPDHPLHLFLHSLQTSTHLLDMELTPLSATETADLALSLTDDAVTAQQAERLYQETEGNPLFVVETVRAGLWLRANGTDTVAAAQGAAPGTLPRRVQAIIETRLAQLSPSARRVSELAAVIGREFGFAVLIHASTQASTQDEASVVAALDELWQRQIVREHGADAYDFSHDKIREVVYTGLSRARQRLLHRTVAQALESVYAADVDRLAGQLAAHYEQAGLPELAVPHYQRAARAAIGVYANSEAISLLQRGVALLATLPDSRERAEQELVLQLMLGSCLVAAGGYGTDAVWSTYSRALSLTRLLGHPPTPAILRALAMWHMSRCNPPKTVDMGEQLLELAHPPVGPPDPVLYVEGHYILGVARFWMGEFVASHEHLLQAVNAYDRHRHKAHVSQFAQDPGPVCLVRRAFTLWHLGYPDQAQAVCREALSLAHQLDHPYTTSYALAFAAWLQRQLRAVEASEMLAEQLIDHCRNYQMDYWLPTGWVLKGAALVDYGNDAGGMAHIQAAIDSYRASKQLFHRREALELLAEAHAHAGRIEQSMATLDEALATVARDGLNWLEAELHRRKGELLHAQNAPVSTVTACFQEALELARRQQAKSLELRAAMSLARLWAEQGRSSEAHALLTDVYAWFTEGFDTVDLREARSLLATLSSAT